MATGDTQVALIVTDLQALQTHCTALISAMGSGEAAFPRALEAVQTAYSSQVHTKISRRLLRVLCGGTSTDDKAEEYPR